MRRAPSLVTFYGNAIGLGGFRTASTSSYSYRHSRLPPAPALRGPRLGLMNIYFNTRIIFIVSWSRDNLSPWTGFSGRIRSHSFPGSRTPGLTVCESFFSYKLDTRRSYQSGRGLEEDPDSPLRAEDGARKLQAGNDLRRLGIELYEMGNYVEALEALTASVEADPSNLQVRACPSLSSHPHLLIGPALERCHLDEVESLGRCNRHI